MAYSTQLGRTPHVGGPIARLRDGDLLRVDAVNGTLDMLTPGVTDRPAATAGLSANAAGTGRELFTMFRNTVGAATAGASIFGG